LVKRGSKPGVLATFHLEETRDYLRNLAQLQAAEDHDRTLDQLHVSFVGGNMWAKFLNRTGISGEEMLLTDTGASHLASEVLPSRFFAGLKELALTDEQGAKLATMAWAKFAQKANTPRMVRTIKMQVNGQTHRAIRSCHSSTYAPYSNLQFVEDLLSNAGEFAQLPVLDWRVTDGAMRLRFAGCEASGIELNKPVTLLECWNSEIGARRVGLRGGMWRLACTNGMGHWDNKQEFSWIHRGDASRIQGGVRNAFENLLTSARGVVDAYNQALNVSIDDAFLWLEQEMQRGEVSARAVVEAQAALKDPTTTPGGTLASVVDAITLIAHTTTDDLIAQYEMENLASSILRRGLSLSLKYGGDRILVEA
jgi:hypothetical protein